MKLELVSIHRLAPIPTENAKQDRLQDIPSPGVSAPPTRIFIHPIDGTNPHLRRPRGGHNHEEAAFQVGTLLRHPIDLSRERFGVERLLVVMAIGVITAAPRAPEPRLLLPSPSRLVPSRIQHAKYVSSLCKSPIAWPTQPQLTSLCAEGFQKLPGSPPPRPGLHAGSRPLKHPTKEYLTSTARSHKPAFHGTR